MTRKFSPRPLALAFLTVMSVLMLSGCAGSGAPKDLRRSCTDCHQEYAEQFSRGNVHQPVREENCQSCHRNHGVIGTVLLRQEEPRLCLKCHGEVSSVLSTQSHLHAPFAQGACSDCHDQHNSEHPFLLHQAESELCFRCHDASMIQGDNVHSPVMEGCRTCHAAHGSDTEKLLPRSEEDLCADCHQVGGKAFIQSHNGYPVVSGCLGCHDVHSSDDDFLLRKSAHVPMAKKECQSCHLPPAQGTFEPLERGRGLCFGCHSPDDFDGSQPHMAALEGDCFQCHAPHAGDYQGLLKERPGELCLSCHSFRFIGSQEAGQGSGVTHAPAREGECLECHRPHQSTEHLLTRSAGELCIGCHADMAAPRRVAHPPAQQRDCLRCHSSHESEVPGLLVEKQATLCLDCHSGLEAQKGRLSIHRPFGNGQCSACHDPHGGSKKNLVEPAPRGCASCHQRLESDRRKPESHSPFREGRCDLCHVSHSSDKPALLTREIDDLCLSCHRDMTPRPGAPEAHDNCAVCHVSHGNEGDAFLRQSLPELCLSCHEVDAFWEKGVGHSPAVEGECATCHDPHFADGERVVDDEWTAAICAPCHETDPPALKASHGGIAPEAGNCRTCHDPHGGPDHSLTFPIKHQPFAEGECAPCHKGGK